MDKQQLLDQLKVMVREGNVTQSDLADIFSSPRQVKMTQIIYYIGGAIVFLGLAILVWQNWETLGFVTRVAATLGASIAFYISGVIFMRHNSTLGVGYALHLIAALVMPIGLFVIFDEAGYDIGDTGVQLTISLILFAVYLLSYIAFRTTIFTLFSLIFGTWLFFALTTFIIGDNPLFRKLSFHEYRVLVVGLTYLLLGYYFSRGPRAALTGVLYVFGSLGFLGAALALGGWKPEQKVFWELVFPLLVFGFIFLSVYIKSRAFLYTGTIFLMAYIFKITAEYFTDSLGWPIALVVAGLVIIAIGYTSVQISHRYLKKQSLPQTNG